MRNRHEKLKCVSTHRSSQSQASFLNHTGFQQTGVPLTVPYTCLKLTNCFTILAYFTYIIIVAAYNSIVWETQGNSSDHFKIKRRVH